MSFDDPRTRALVALIGSAFVAMGCTLHLGSDNRAEAKSAATASAAEAELESPAETAAALALLERMSSYLASRETFRFHAEVSYDAVQPWGQRIEFGSARDLAVRRPDEVRVDVHYWDGSSEILSYDGSEIWLASPTRHAYARAAHTGPLEQVLDRLATDFDAPTPLADLIDPQLYARLAPLIESGARVGAVVLDGRACEQIAFRTAETDFQLFVEQGDQPVPRRLVIDYREEPGHPQFRATLHDWDLAPSLPANYFRVTPPIGAQRVPIRELLDVVLEGPAESGELGANP